MSPLVPDEREADREFLDGAFCQLLEAAEEGRDFALEVLLSERPDLSSTIHSLAELARGVAVAPRREELPLDLPGYTFVSEIGRGGMGRVFLARQESAAGRPVAVKVLPSFSALAGGQSRLRREAQAIAALRHKHIVAVHDVLRVQDSSALVMEFVDGGSLQQLIDALNADRFAGLTREDQLARVAEFLGGAPAVRAPDYARLIARMGVEIADALHTVHASKLLHRDVKPSNVLLRRDGTALLSDFGLVQEVRERTVSTVGGFAGTPAYSSPEQLRAIERLDVRTDVYSLGATLFHALTLRRPHAGDSAVQVLRSIETTASQTAPRLRRSSAGKHPTTPAIPRDLETIVRKAMDPDRERRYDTAAEMAADLSRFLDDRPIRARPVSLYAHTTKFVRRNRRAVWTGAIVALLVGLLAAGLLVRTTVLPVWSAGALQSARSNLFRPVGMGDVFNFGFWELLGDPRRTVEARASVRDETTRFTRALANYDRSIALGDWSAATSAERDAVALLVAAFTGQGVATLEPVHASVASHVHWLTNPTPAADEFRDRAERSSPSTGLLPELPTRDVLQIGLISFALGDVGTAIAAWKQLEHRGVDDAFGAGVLGTLYLIEEQPALAYARLQRAVIAYPTSADFLAAASDAALACGDTVRGRQFLELARQIPGADPFALRRLDLLARFDEGQVDAVHAEVVHAFASGQNGQAVSPYLAYQLARRLQAVGRDDLLFEMSALACASSPAPKRSLRLFTRMAADHWNRADQSQRRAIIIEWAQNFNRAATWRSTLPFALHQASYLTPEYLPDAISLRDMVDSAHTRLFALYGIKDKPSDFSSIAELNEPLRSEVADWLLTGEGAFPDDAARILRERYAAVNR